LLIKPFWFFGIEVSVQNRLGNEIYGLYASLLSITIIFNFLLDFGITNFNNREIARYPFLISKYFSNLISIKIIFACVYFVLCLILGFFIGYKGTVIYILLLLVINQILSSIILYLRSNISGLQRFATDSMISVLDKFITIVLLSLLLWTSIFHGRFNIALFVISQTIGYLVTLTIALIIVIRACGKFTFHFNKHYAFLMIKKALPFTLLVFLMGMYNRMEPILLERTLIGGDEQAGIYAQGFRIFEALSNFVLLFPVILLPMFSSNLKKGENIQPLISVSTSMILIPVLITSVFCFFYSSEIMNLLYHSDKSGNVFKIIILGLPGITLTYIFGTLLTANGNFKQLNTMAFGALILNLSINLILIPRLKAQGSAFASFLTQFLTGCFQLLLAIKILKLNDIYKGKTIETPEETKTLFDRVKDLFK